MTGDCGHGWLYHNDGPCGPCYKCLDEKLERNMSEPLSRSVRYTPYTITQLSDEIKKVENIAENLHAALTAIGVIGNGYCFCSENRDTLKKDHEPECSYARLSIGFYEKYKEEN